MLDRAFSAALLVVVLSPTATLAAEVTLPKGTFLEVYTVTPLSNATATKGDKFEARVRHGLWVENRLVVPAESAVEGEVKVVRSPRDGAKSGALGLKFETVTVGGKRYDIEGVLTSFQQDERKRMLDLLPKLSTGRKLDVIVIGSGTEPPTRRVSTLVGLSGVDRDDLADEWAPGGLGPAAVAVAAGTYLHMELDEPVTLAAPAGASARGPNDRNISIAESTVKAAQDALRAAKYYAGETTGTLDQPTRNAILRFQITTNQPATGDLDETTVVGLIKARK